MEDLNIEKLKAETIKVMDELTIFIEANLFGKYDTMSILLALTKHLGNGIASVERSSKCDLLEDYKQILTECHEDEKDKNDNTD